MPSVVHARVNFKFPAFSQQTIFDFDRLQGRDVVKTKTRRRAQVIEFLLISSSVRHFMKVWANVLNWNGFKSSYLW